MPTLMGPSLLVPVLLLVVWRTDVNYSPGLPINWVRLYVHRLRLYEDWPWLHVDGLRLCIDRMRLYVDRVRLYVNRARLNVDWVRLYVNRARLNVDRLWSYVHHLGRRIHWPASDAD
jgi:hypothetical protein